LFPEDGAVRLNGCGMLLINPPWNLKVSLKALLFLLAKLLRQDSDARIRLDWLVTE
jgi:23S rRNA (adenine2030-N6)-methyltransferase